MYGCFVTEPEDDGADLGAVFFHNAGYSTACGHGTIALVTWAIDTGRVAGPEVVVDVPSGRLPTIARLEVGRVASVRFRNVPAFVHARGLAAAGLQVDVAFGGAFYASVEERVEPSELPRLIELGRAIKSDLEASHSIVHPDEPELRNVYGVIFWQEEGTDPLTQRNVTVFADGEVDRSPCGSGTSARLALLHDEGRLAAGESLRHLSVVGSEFTGRVVEETPAGVVTEVEGSAHLTGRHEFVLDPSDELGEGFLLR
jgi:proline racemase